MTPQRIEDYTRDHGAIIDHRALDEPLANLFEIPVERATRALYAARHKNGTDLQPVDASVVYVGNPDVNAFADQRLPSECLICFFTGTAVSLLDACLKLASRLDPATGRPLAKADKIIVYPEKLWIGGTNAPAHCSDLSGLSSKLREICAFSFPHVELGVLLFELAASFIAMHEVMHIVLGHSAYLRQTNRLQGVVEFSERREEKLPSDFSQMLEFSADRNACRGIARRLILDGVDSSYEETLLANVTVDRSVYLVGNLVTSITLLLHLFPKRFCSIDRLFGSHPHPYTRMQWMAMELGHELGQELDFRATILTPMAETAATLKSNFTSPDNWWEYAEQDVSSFASDHATPKTDLLYQQILTLARQWSSQLMPYGPIYPQLNDAGKA
jgi:hypothetical protein